MQQVSAGPWLAKPGALVVDDDDATRHLLRRLLVQLGYAVTECCDGRAAVAACAECVFDIVFMDVLMPVMDGIEATARIRAQQVGRALPIVFLTALSDNDTVARCMEAGGDDFLTKPYRLHILRSKIASLERVRGLRDHVARLRMSHERETSLAKRFLQQALSLRSFEHPAIQARVRPAQDFGGDIHLRARAPSGEIFVLLGDFAGQGLAAALGALPVVETFHAMTAKGFAPEQILRAIDRKLAALFPTGMFLAAQFVALDPALEFVRVANCGMPDILVYRADTPHEHTAIVAHSIPLGIDADTFLRDGLRTLAITPGSRVVLSTDGIYEACDEHGATFGAERVQAILAAAAAGQAPDDLLAALDRHAYGAPLEDDVALVEIHCNESLVSAPVSGASEGADDDVADRDFAITMSLRGRTLASIDPVPLIMSQLKELRGVSRTHSALFTVLSELYTNALDHGVLELDSKLKQGPGGFERYFAERTRRLAALTDGQVDLTLTAQGECLSLRVTDSGRGFASAQQAPAAGPRAPFGRGIPLVRALCDEVVYDRRGSTVEVRFPQRQGGDKSAG